MKKKNKDKALPIDDANVNNVVSNDDAEVDNLIKNLEKTLDSDISEVDVEIDQSEESEVDKEDAQVFTKALVLKTFTIQIPMQGHRTTVCTVTYYKDSVIDDPYIVNYLKDLEQPLQFT